MEWTSLALLMGDSAEGESCFWFFVCSVVFFSYSFHLFVPVFFCRIPASICIYLCFDPYTFLSIHPSIHPSSIRNARSSLRDCERRSTSLCVGIPVIRETPHFSPSEKVAMCLFFTHPTRSVADFLFHLLRVAWRRVVLMMCLNIF